MAAVGYLDCSTHPGFHHGVRVYAKGILSGERASEDETWFAHRPKQAELTLDAVRKWMQMPHCAVSEAHTSGLKEKASRPGQGRCSLADEVDNSGGVQD
eukprot:3231380-Rhodomonas_salina.3